MLRGLLDLFLPKNQVQQQAEAHRAILRESARIGGTLFGPVSKNVRREFFCLDEHTWVWHEEWTDDQKQHHVRTTRYDVRPYGIFKAQDGQSYRPVSREEAANLYYAVHAYDRAVDDYFVPRLAPGVTA